MRIDLKQDARRVDKYIAKRAKDYPVYVNAGPGEDEAEIKLITLGFSFDQAGWVALVFDTRPDAAFDGQWQGYLEATMLPFDRWTRAFDAMCENGSVLSLTEHDGARRTFLADSEMEDLAACFGRMCRHVLTGARNRGVFQNLPLADDCRLAVEEHEGFYGWIEGAADQDEAVDEAQLKQTLRRAAQKLPKARRIRYWIEQLDQLAAGQPCAAAPLIDHSEFVLEELARLGKDAVEPLLRLAVRWADQPEFQVEGGELQEGPMQTVMCELFATVAELAVATPAVEKLLQQYLRTALQVKPVRKLWGIAPYHAARTLHALFPGYPQPKCSATTNKLLNAAQFAGHGPTKRK